MESGLPSLRSTPISACASPNSSDLNEELENFWMAVKYGADTVMDLSTAAAIPTRSGTAIISNPKLIGTVVLIYQAPRESVLSFCNFDNFTEDDFLLPSSRSHAQQGVN
jgi:phosphomethylpyrimidine synthase